LLARTLRFETADLSRPQQDEALAQAISYFENDLVLVDWNSAVIYDRDYEDTASVLELINVELQTGHSGPGRTARRVVVGERAGRERFEIDRRPLFGEAAFGGGGQVLPA
jgi:hypothetical protein